MFWKSWQTVLPGSSYVCGTRGVATVDAKKSVEIETLRPQVVRLPLLSGKSSAALMAISLTVAAGILLPLCYWIPVWIDAEIILMAWWAIWGFTLVWLLHRGRQIDDDHTLGQPRNWIDWLLDASARHTESDWKHSWWLLPLHGEGCFFLLVFMVVFAIGFISLWLLVEFFVPLVVFAGYFLIRGMMAKVANDAHDCRGHWGRSLFWGITWATLYLLPVSGMVWITHILLFARS